MKAPDKIYVCIPQRLNLSTFNEDSKYVGMAYTDKGNLTSPQIEQYIRKDALVEWLLKGIEMSEICGSEYGDACAQAYQGVVDKINSM